MQEQRHEDRDRAASAFPCSSKQDAERIGGLRALKHRVWAIRGYLHFLYGLMTSYLYDIRRYYRAASKGNEAVRAGKSRYTELRSWIAADAHKIEKGLALREPRPGFGKPVIRRLLEEVARYHADFGPDHITEMAVNILVAYGRFNHEHDLGDADFDARVAGLAAALGETHDVARGGVVSVARAAFIKKAQLPGIADFFQSRHSVRNFSDDVVSMESIEAAVGIAQRTPSVCNRQSWKTYAYLDHETAQRVLACQQGNRGFGDTAGGVLVVTSDLRTFFSYGERNQGFIDGGMFAMSLAYGLHAQGLGSCCLNWCAELAAERQLRAVTGIPDHEAVIMMIAIGHLPESLHVAQSVRKPLSEVLVPGHVSK